MERFPLQKYWDRPVELENLSLFQLYLGYKFYNGKWTRCERENVVRIWPRPSPQRDGPQWNEFCHIKIILHISHRSLQQLTKNDSLSWSDLFNRNLAESENEFKDMLGLSVDNLVVVLYTCHFVLQEANDYRDDICPDWMILAEMDLNATIDGSSGLGLCNVD